MCGFKPNTHYDNCARKGENEYGDSRKVLHLELQQLQIFDRFVDFSFAKLLHGVCLFFDEEEGGLQEEFLVLFEGF